MREYFVSMSNVATKKQYHIVFGIKKKKTKHNNRFRFTLPTTPIGFLYYILLLLSFSYDVLLLLS